MNDKLKISANKLLNEKNIIETLSLFGDVKIVGSYAFDLMTEPDIDVIVITDKPKESSEEAASLVLKQHVFQKIEYGDFQNFKKENRPEFFIFNMRTPWEGQIFEIEVWFLPEAKAKEKIIFTEMMKNISSSEREQIIRLKIERKEKGLNKNKLSSFDIYKKVLNF